MIFQNLEILLIQPAAPEGPKRSFHMCKAIHIKKKKRYLFIPFLLLLLFAQLYSLSQQKRRQQDLSEHVLRLHILAASDSETDQSHKLLVRDAVLSEMEPFMSGASSKEEAIELINAHLSEITATATQTLLELGDPNPVSVSICRDYFPTKSYGALTFPAGEYDALRICIGQASGHNWWCVMYPTLCFIDASTVTIPNDSLNTLEQDLQPDTYQSLFSGEEQTKTVFRFRCLTFLNRFLE
jgi:stage II sporulation protein R